MKFLCIDVYSIFYRAFHAIPDLTNKDGVHTNAIVGFLNIVMPVFDKLQPKYAAAAFDTKKPTFRHKLSPDYKAGRKPMPPELAEQLPILRELLDALGIRTVELEGYEADDILGTLSLSAKKQKIDTVLLTGDADVLQLIDAHTQVYKHVKGGVKAYDEAAFFEEYGFAPINLIDYKALAGDSSDNYPGVRGIGDKTARGLITKYGTIEKMYADKDNLELGKSAKEKIIAGEADAEFSKTLATINREAPIGDVTEFTLLPRDDASLSALLTRLEMFAALKKLGLSASTAAVAESQAENKKTETSPSEYKIIDFAEFAEVMRSGESAQYAFIFDGKKLFAAAGEKLSATEDETHITAFFTDETAKITFDAKPAYKYCEERGISLKNLKNDALICAYLLNTNSSEYNVADLCAVYHRNYGFDGDRDFYDIAALESLEAALLTKLQKAGGADLLYSIELPLTETLAKMEVYGVKVDPEGIRAFGEKLKTEFAKKEEEIFLYSGEPFNVGSPKQVGEILFDKFGLRGGKKGKNGAYSTGAEVLEGLRHKNPIVGLILEYRQLTKLNSTYVEGLIPCIAADGRIHSVFKQTETRTGRISSAEPNLQNIPVRTELGRNMRKFFTAEAGKILIDADYSQIELRILAHMADDHRMTEDFLSGADIHTAVAAQVFGVPQKAVTGDMRRIAKVVNFGIVYGIGAFSLQKDIGGTVKEAQRYIDNYFAKYMGVKQFMDETEEFAAENHYVTTMFGRRREIPELISSNKNLRNFGLRAARNAPIQGTAADIIKIAMNNVRKRLEAEKIPARLILQIHDELILEADEAAEAAASAVLREEMENAAKLRVPLIAEVKTGKTWFDCKQ
ncbi:MAG: DNA polymerase I [Ruminococcus sp.]|nr:DNA polymerase I [Ruminococcus sp.]